MRILRGRVQPRTRRRILQGVSVALAGLLVWLGISLGETAKAVLERHRAMLEKHCPVAFEEIGRAHV